MKQSSTRECHNSAAKNCWVFLNWMFITVFTTARLQTLSRAKWTHFMPSNSISLRGILFLLLSSHLYLGQPRCSFFPAGFTNKILHIFSSPTPRATWHVLSIPTCQIITRLFWTTQLKNFTWVRLWTTSSAGRMQSLAIYTSCLYLPLIRPPRLVH
jgi:hypothetical protein